MERSSRISGFYNLGLEEKLHRVKEFAGLTDEECEAIKVGRPSLDEVENMAENVIGVIGIPLGIATNFVINGKEYLIPMATEEPSVIAAASNGAKIARKKGGFFTTSTEPLMEVQIQTVKVSDPHAGRNKILENKDEIIRMANTQDPALIELGGGARDVEVRIVDGRLGRMLVTHLCVDTKDAMGANTVNRMAEYVAPFIENITGGKVYLRVVDNYAVKRLARARAIFDKEALGGEAAVEGMLYGYDCAYSDPHRATGHNKGTTNGISAVVLATGNDTRAIEAGYHAYAARDGQYRALPVWEKNAEGDLVGTLELPVAVGIVGGMSHAHPVARAALKILGVKSSRELGEILAAVGLAQKVAAERALAMEGIMFGHTKMHARSIATMAGAQGQEVRQIAEIMIKEGKVRFDRAKELVAVGKGKRE
jgi:hydroxymethylglutaryl-CoA reductase